MMKIVFLNVWNGKVREQLRDFLKNEIQSTDVFCFQEATDEMKQEFSDQLSGYTEVSGYKYHTEHDVYPQSIFIRNGIEILSSGSLMEGEIAHGLAVYVELKGANGSLYICNMHGTARPDDKRDSPVRIKQSKELIEFFRDNAAPVVIGGDFNISPDTESIEMFEANGFRNLVKEYNIQTTRNHYAWDRFPDNKLYYSDYVFLNKKVQLENFSVVDDEVSDHLPLIVEINNEPNQ